MARCSSGRKARCCGGGIREEGKEGGKFLCDSTSLLCSLVQRVVAACCGVLQMLQRDKVSGTAYRSVLLRYAEFCSVLQLQRVAACCSVLQRVETIAMQNIAGGAGKGAGAGACA